MNVVMMMFDTLNRRFLEPYGSRLTRTPSFNRLAEHTVRFDNCYTGSLPCMPARRELHTGRYNFLHRSWGPIEPFDDSMPETLGKNGIWTHLSTDHGHYWEDGGATYHTRYNSWDNIRGQEGDKWQSGLGAVDSDPSYIRFSGLTDVLYQQHVANREAIREERDLPIVRTFDSGLGFIDKYYGKGDFFLQIESFSPHEPYMTSDRFKDLYEAPHTRRFEWPVYAPVSEPDEVVEEFRKSYFAELATCDEQLGRLLDEMDEKNMWDDTMLIVCTDHGNMLSEHGYWSKNYMPSYDEIVHTPLFIWDPRHPKMRGVSRKSLVQTCDIPASILEFFGIPCFSGMQGRPLSPVITSDVKVHDDVLFGTYGCHVCITDGRYVYMRAPRDYTVPLNEYTLMPTHLMSFFTEKELSTMQRHEPFSFTKGLPVMQIATDNANRCISDEDYLFDLEEDPGEDHNLAAEVSCDRFEDMLRAAMKRADAPEELYTRLGL